MYCECNYLGIDLESGSAGHARYVFIIRQQNKAGCEQMV